MMELNFEKHKQRLYPQNLFEIFPKVLTEELIKGFFYNRKQGVALRYVEWDQISGSGKVTDDVINPFNPLNRRDSRFFNPVCRLYRQVIKKESTEGEGTDGEGTEEEGTKEEGTKEGNSECNKYDKFITECYLKGEITEKSVFRYICHLGLIDLTYPITINNRIYGVLFAGQVIPQTDEEIGTIKTRIKEKCKNDDQSYVQKILNSLDDEEIKQWKEPNFEQECTNYLRMFGNSFQGIIDSLYNAYEEKVFIDVLKESADYLASVNLSSQEEWWNKCEELIKSFCDFISLNAIHLYSLQDGYYVRKIPAGNEENCLKIHARDIRTDIATNQFIQLTEEKLVLKEKLGFDIEDTVHLYLHKNPVIDVPISTLLVFNGILSKPFERIVQDFYKLLCQRIDVVALNFYSRNTENKFKQSVAEFCHDIRTPLQAAVFDLGETLWISEVDKNLSLKKRIEDTVIRMVNAKDYTFSLQEQTKLNKTEINLSRIINRVVDDLKPIADHHPCKISRMDIDESIWIKGNEIDLQRCFKNLLENAIKYSFRSYYDPSKMEIMEREVRISLVLTETKIVKVCFSNYGIGIPEDSLVEILKGRKRANVRDDRYKREGTGYGIQIAIRILEEHEGYLNIESKPADNSPRKESEKYHRYITTVFAYLPIFDKG